MKDIMTETKIYVGLNDSVEKKQLMETEKYVSVLRNVCYGYNTPFSFGVEEGGYIHENGEYTRETTLVLTLIDADKNIVSEIAKDLFKIEFVPMWYSDGCRDLASLEKFLKNKMFAGRTLSSV